MNLTKKNGLDKERKGQVGGERDGSAVKLLGCLCRGPEFDSQHPHQEELICQTSVVLQLEKENVFVCAHIQVLVNPLELQVVESCPTWVLGMELQFPERATSAHNF